MLVAFVFAVFAAVAFRCRRCRRFAHNMSSCFCRAVVVVTCDVAIVFTISGVGVYSVIVAVVAIFLQLLAHS